MLRSTDPNDATFEEVFLIYKAALIHGNLSVSQWPPPRKFRCVAHWGGLLCRRHVWITVKPRVPPIARAAMKLLDTSWIKMAKLASWNDASWSTYIHTANEQTSTDKNLFGSFKSLLIVCNIFICRLYNPWFRRSLWWDNHDPVPGTYRRDSGSLVWFKNWRYFAQERGRFCVCSFFVKNNFRSTYVFIYIYIYMLWKSKRQWNIYGFKYCHSPRIDFSTSLSEFGKGGAMQK